MYCISGRGEGGGQVCWDLGAGGNIWNKGEEERGLSADGQRRRVTGRQIFASQKEEAASTQNGQTAEGLPWEVPSFSLLAVCRAGGQGAGPGGGDSRPGWRALPT